MRIRRSNAGNAGAELALSAITAVWGLTFVLVEQSVRTLSPLAFATFAFIPAAVIAGVAFARDLRRLPLRGWIAGARMGAFLTAGYLFVVFALSRTTASHVGFVNGLFVVLTPVFGAVLFRQRAGRLVWAASIASAVGLFLISGAGGRPSFGDVLALGGASAFAMHVLMTGRAAAAYPPGALLAIQVGLTGVVAAILAAATGGLAVPTGGFVWSVLAIEALVAIDLGFLVQTWAQRRAAPARAAVILSSEPVFAGLFAFLIKGETLPALGWIGAAIIVASIVVVQLSGQRRTRSAPLRLTDESLAPVAADSGRAAQVA
jgi:drug/metabolite transporter (DMT)-like permease